MPGKRYRKLTSRSGKGAEKLLGELEQVVVLHTSVPLAFCFGLLKPHVCISTGLVDTLTVAELKAVLLPAVADIRGSSAIGARIAYLLDDHPPASPFSARSLVTSSIGILLVCFVLQLALS
ncbi:MAG TPA: M48 family metalloprotease [Anaerolineae bacterium]